MGMSGSGSSNALSVKSINPEPMHCQPEYPNEAPATIAGTAVAMFAPGKRQPAKAIPTPAVIPTVPTVTATAPNAMLASLRHGKWPVGST